MIWISVDKSSKIPLIRQLYDQIRTRILNGGLHAGYNLPSTRELASSLQISRNVAIEAYEMLAAEGYIKGLQGSGMYAAQDACLNEYREFNGVVDFYKGTSPKEDEDMINFRSGLPALDLFPKRKWGSLFHNISLDIPSSALGYGEPAGCIGLRRILVKYLYKVRGVYCRPDNIIITTGAVQALQLLTHLLLKSGDNVLLEDPSNIDLQKILSSTGAKLVPVPVDEYGMKTCHIQDCSFPKAAYLTPSHQFPMGGILPVQRRIELIEYARKSGCFVIEDDYDSEFRYEGPPVSSIQSLYPERVIYIGTFSKIMFPAVRIGYLVLPDSLVDHCRRLKRHSDYQTPILEQHTLGAFIEGGLLERHISKMKKVYFKRQQSLIQALNTCFQGSFKIFGKSTGLHVVVEFKFKITREMLNNLRKFKVRVIPVEIHSMHKDSHKNQFILGYGNLTEEQIEEGVKRMWKAFSANGT